VRISVLDARGDEVRVLDTRAALAAGALGRSRGRTDGVGSDRPRRRYRVRVVLRREGRSLVVGAPIRLDNTPPRPIVEWIGAYGTRGPEILRCRRPGRRGPPPRGPSTGGARVRDGARRAAPRPRAPAPHRDTMWN
jgi:hypothetical protein